MAITTALTWSFAFVCVRETLSQLTKAGASSWNAATSLLFIRMSLTALCFLPMILKQRHWFNKLNRADWIRVALIAMSTSVGYHLPLNLGAQRIPSGFVSLLIALGPIFAALLARVFLKERLGFSRCNGIVLGLVGISFCIRSQNKSDLFHVSDLIGPLFILIASIDGAFFAILGRTIRKEIPVEFKLGLAMVLASLLSLPFTELKSLQLLSQLNLWGWLANLYLAIASTCIASILWYSALKVLDTLEVSIYLNITTLFAMIWGYLLFGEQIGFLYVLGATCVMFAVFLSIRKEAI